MSRKSISKKLRFEVFKRDSFKCQYCGLSAPDVVLHVDHINPVSGGGGNEIVNLITSCSSCNQGKGAIKLDDQSVAAKQRKQLEELSERREQIRLIAKWRNELLDIESEALRTVEEWILKKCRSVLTDKGKNQFRKSLQKYGLNEVLKALETSANQYLDDPGAIESIEKFLDYTHRICFWNYERKIRPEVAQFSLICGIANRNWFSCNKSHVWNLVQDAHYNHGVDLDYLVSLARSTSGIIEFERCLSKAINEVSHG